MRRILLVASLAFLLVASFTVVLSKEADLPEVSFGRERRVVSEDAGQVDIGVTLSQSSTVTATVGYETRGESAVAGMDFLTATGTLTFAPGIIRQVISLTVLDDTEPEADESLLLVLSNPVSATLGLYPTTIITLTDDGDPYLTFLPIVARRWPPIPYTPVLNPIGNSDQDNTYTVHWNAAELADTYVLEEATSSDFSDAELVYQGPNTSWITPNPGKKPGLYFYRVKALNTWGQSSWSNIYQVRIYPLYVGLHLRWDGMGYIRGYRSYDVGYHKQNYVAELTDPNTVHIENHVWYDPNPSGWGPDHWNTYYSITTNEIKSSDMPRDPSWKWGNYWIVPSNVSFVNGGTIQIEGQPFSVSGPHLGYTAFGKEVHYWNLVNKNKFLYVDSGGDWTQYVHPGDITLHYDAGNTRLLIHRDVLRRGYYQGELTSETVQYISNLTEADSFSSLQETRIASTHSNYGMNSTSLGSNNVFPEHPLPEPGFAQPARTIMKTP